MDIRVPVRLERDPIIESIFEIRFSSKEKLVSELLPGMIYGELKDKFPDIVNLPIREMPVVFRQRDPELMFQPIVSLQGKGCKVNIGDKAVSLGISRPYIGWAEKKELLKTVIDCLEKTSLIDVVERYSLKYVNIVPRFREHKGILSDLKVNFELGDFVVSDTGLNIRSEIELDGILNIINLVPGASYKKGGDVLKGVLVNVDAIKQDLSSNTRLKDILTNVDEIHAVEKKIFFGLLKEETIESMGPIWE